MTVFIVWWVNFHSEKEFSGVFSNEENAKEYISRFSISEQSSFRIETTSLDNW